MADGIVIKHHLCRSR